MDFAFLALLGGVDLGLPLHGQGAGAGRVGLLIRGFPTLPHDLDPGMAKPLVWNLKK